MTRRWSWLILAVGALVIFALLLTYNRFPQPTGNPKVANRPSQTVEIGTFSTAIDYAPYYVAKHNGWLDEAASRHNAKLQYLSFEALPAINDALAAGRLDVLLEADTPAIIQEASGNDIEAISPLASLSLQLIVPARSRIRTLNDVRGKRIGVLFGTGFHYALVAALEAKGFSRKDYALVNLAPPEAKGALASGGIDAWAAWPPFPQQAKVEMGANVIPFPGQVTSLAFAAVSFRDQNGPLLKDLDAALQRARKFIAANPQEAKGIVSSETRLPRQIVDLAWPSMDFGFVVTPAVQAQVQRQADFLAKEKYVTGKVDVDDELIRAVR